VALRKENVTFQYQVPIHAYPVVAKINCPATLDFGMVPIGQELEKSFSFSCDVPIQFEYKLSCLDANSDFTIAPMAGIIPAEGSVQVTVLFRPTRLYTSLQKVSGVAVSQRCTASSHFPRKRYPSASPSSVSALSQYVRSSIFPRNSILHFGQVQLRGNTLPPDPMPKPPSVNPSSSHTLRVSCCRHTTILVNFCARNAVEK
jgi:hypothetical protein